MIHLKDVAKLTKQREIRKMGAAVYYVNPVTLSVRDLFRAAKIVAAPKMPQDLSPTGRIDAGLHYLNWTDPGNGSMHQADSWDVWVNRATANKVYNVNVKEPQVGFTFGPEESMAFTVTAKNAFGVSKEALADFNTATGGYTPPPPPPKPSGFSGIAFQNCDPDHHTLYFYLQDTTAGTDWTQVASLDAQYDSSGGCPGNASPHMIPLTDGHNYNWVIIDADALGCDGNNPDTYACRVKGPGSVHGSKNGGTLPIGFP